jgi:ABC-type amino acid transport system permease subunit
MGRRGGGEAVSSFLVIAINIAFMQLVKMFVSHNVAAYVIGTIVGALVAVAMYEKEKVRR